MLDRRVIALILMLCLGVGWLGWNWKVPAGVPLQAGQPMTSSQRYYQDLGGIWSSFSSLRQAWTEMSAAVKKPGAQLMLPASREFKVAARSFRLTPEWSARTMLLVLNGVEGEAEVYLNGADNAHRVGTIAGSGGQDVLEIPPAAFRYEGDNILLIRLNKTKETNLFSVPGAEGGRVLGKVYLEGVTESSLELVNLNVAWEGATAKVSLETAVRHHSFMEQGPWTVRAVVSDGSALVAEQELVLQDDNSREQAANLMLQIPEARLWSPGAPFLYQVYLTVANSKGDRDDLAFPLGLRSLELVEGKWQLNGEKLDIHGVEISPEEQFLIRSTGQIETWLSEKKDQGVQVVYFNGPVPDEMWLQAADRIGIGIWGEWPAALRPAERLPEFAAMRPLLTAGALHPSLWAWTVGKGLDVRADPKVKAYLQHADQEINQSLAFYLRKEGADLQGFPPERSPELKTGKIQGPWGEVELGIRKEQGTRWPDAPAAAAGWAGLASVVWLFNVRAVQWRYKEIGEKKPKRRLRHAWFWHGAAVLVRMGTLAGMITDLGYRLPSDLGPWFPNSWPLLNLIQAQSPWLWWAVLTGVFTLLRLIQAGIVAPYLPGSPHPLGLVFWLERRYRWNAAVALAWALSPLGIPLLFALGGYIIFSIFLIPWRISDIRRAGGRYKPFFLVPGITGLVLLGVILYWGSDIMFFVRFLLLTPAIK